MAMSHLCILFLFSAAHPDLMTSLEYSRFFHASWSVFKCHWVTSVFPSKPGNPYLELNPSQSCTIDLSVTSHVLITKQQDTQTQTANTARSLTLIWDKWWCCYVDRKQWIPFRQLSDCIQRQNTNPTHEASKLIQLLVNSII